MIDGQSGLQGSCDTVVVASLHEHILATCGIVLLNNDVMFMPNRYLGPVLLRALIAWCPRSWRPPVRVWGAVLKLSPQGEILQLLLDPDGSRVATASAATEHKGRLFLGSIMGGELLA